LIDNTGRMEKEFIFNLTIPERPWSNRYSPGTVSDKDIIVYSLRDDSSLR
jgi:hypothetical protein